MSTSTSPNVWTQMNYIPPRGPCHYKASLMSARCACLRFMLHPLKSTTSFECDGCTHHASFHAMENQAEEEVRRRWVVEGKEEGERPRKRVRAITAGGGSAVKGKRRVVEVVDEGVVEVD